VYLIPLQQQNTHVENQKLLSASLIDHNDTKVSKQKAAPDGCKWFTVPNLPVLRLPSFTMTIETNPSKPTEHSAFSLYYSINVRSGVFVHMDQTLVVILKNTKKKSANAS